MSLSANNGSPWRTGFHFAGTCYNVWCRDPRRPYTASRVLQTRLDRGIDALDDLRRYELGGLNRKEAPSSPEGKWNGQNIRIGARRGGRADRARHMLRRSTQSVKHDDEFAAKPPALENLVRHPAPESSDGFSPWPTELASYMASS